MVELVKNNNSNGYDQNVDEVRRLLVRHPVRNGMELDEKLDHGCRGKKITEENQTRP